MIDRTSACAETRPRLLPPGTAFEAPGDAASPCDRDDQHRRRPEGMPADSEQRARATTIEQHPQRRDIAAGADLLVLDADPRDESVARLIGKRPRMSPHPLRQLLPRLALRQSPAPLAPVLSGLGTDIHLTVADPEI